jgi:hypothetical protein
MIEETLKDIIGQLKVIQDNNDAILHLLSKMASPDPIFDLQAAAKHLNMSPHTIRKHAREILKDHRTNHKLLFKQSELDAWNANRPKKSN